MGLETQYTRDLCKIARAQGAMVKCNIGSVWEQPGWPDRIFIHERICNSVAWVEFKMMGEKLEPHQKKICNDLLKHGCCVHEAYFTGCGYFVGLAGRDWVRYELFLKDLIDASYLDGNT